MLCSTLFIFIFTGVLPNVNIKLAGVGSFSDEGKNIFISPFSFCKHIRHISEILYDSAPKTHVIL